MPFRALRVSLVMLSVVAASAAAQSADAPLDRAIAAWSKVRTARATFVQTLTNSLTGSSGSARGEYQQQRPNKLAVHFTDPEGDRIVSDGAWMWVYLPSSAPGQVIKRRATDANAAPVDVTGEFLDNPRAKYDVTTAGSATVEGHPATALVFLPKAGHETPFTKATVWVDTDDGLIRQFETVEPSGITRHIRITSLEVNVPVDRGAFTFSPPPGARIVER
jgi:outer membrane lipoprotein carrier protein